MLMQPCSSFNCNHMNDLLSHYHQQASHLNLPKEISNYEDFCHKIPILYDVDFSQRVQDFFRLGLLNSCTFVTSSATSGNYKLIPLRIGRVITPAPDNYPYQLFNTINKLKIFTPTDVVANLFSAGGMATLFDSCNRLLEMCNTSVLPIGRLDDHNRTSSFLKFMVDLSVNTLFGTPSSMMQCTKALQEAQLELNIEKAVFAGEALTRAKYNYIQQFFPRMKVYGLYGQTETGIVGIHTPACHDDIYHLLTDFFFFEITSHGEILVTDLTKPPIPLFRYYVGDLGEFINDTCSCNLQSSLLLLKGRCDKKFNYMGNLISYEKIKKIISRVYGKQLDVQIQLATDHHGNDLLNIIVDDDETNLSSIKEKLIQDLYNVDEINEGIQKKVGIVNIFPRDQFLFSQRQKIPLIYDARAEKPASFTKIT